MPIMAASGNDHEQCQGEFQPLDIRQLRCFDLAAVLQDIEENLDIPSIMPLDAWKAPNRLPY
jgi:hypothetical protein